mgnify:CR=1 FL=1
MIDQLFHKLGGQKAVQSFMEKRHPSMYKEPEPSMRERTDEGSSMNGGSVRKSAFGLKSTTSPK